MAHENETDGLQFTYLDDEQKEVFDLALLTNQNVWNAQNPTETNMMDYLQLDQSNTIQPMEQTLESPIVTPSSAFKTLNLNDPTLPVLPASMSTVAPENLTQEQLLGVLQQLLTPGQISPSISPGTSLSTQISPSATSTSSPPGFATSPGFQTISPLPLSLGHVQNLASVQAPSPRKRGSAPVGNTEEKRVKGVRPASPSLDVLNMTKQKVSSPKADLPLASKPVISSPLVNPIPTSPSGVPNLIPPIFGLTPASLMKMDRPSVEPVGIMPKISSKPTGKPKSRHHTRTGSNPAVSRTVNALVSPHLKPLLPAAPLETTVDLAIKSNYQHIKEGSHVLDVLQLPPETTAVEEKKSLSKQADQKRRDTLRQAFDVLRDILPFESTLDRNPSKVHVLRRAVEYVQELENQRDADTRLMARMQEEIRNLRHDNYLHGVNDKKEDWEWELEQRTRRLAQENQPRQVKRKASARDLTEEDDSTDE